MRPRPPVQIILARHGKPKLRHWAWISPHRMKESIEAYNRADVILGGVPSDTLEITAASGVVVSSTLRRCIQSARHLCGDRAFVTEQIFCEADLPHPHWHYPKLPLSVWGVIFRLAWFSGFSANAESFAQANARAHAAAQRLIALAEENGSVFLVGHGIMTMLIAKHLLACGWTGSKRPINKYWRFSVYQAPV